MRQIQLNLPDNWSEVTIKQFTELNRVRDLKLESYELMVELIAVLSNRERSEIEPLNLEQLTKAYNSISFIDELKLPTDVKRTIEVDGKHFHCEMDISKITGGQYIGFKEFIKDPKEIVFNIHNILAVLYVPMGRKYDGLIHNDVSELFYNKLSIAEAYPVAVFFCNLLTNLSGLIRGYSESKMIRTIASM